MSRRGMTLIELVVGLVVTAITTMAGFGTIGLLIDRRTAAADAVRETVRASAVRRTITSWLEGIRLVPGEEGRSFQLVDRATHGSPDDELTFVTTAPTPVGGENAIVRLYVERDPRAPQRGLVAEMQDWSGAHVLRVPLDSAVTSLDIRCRTGILGRMEWMSGWMSSALLPRGVELRMGGASASALDPLLSVPLTVVFPGGQ